MEINKLLAHFAQLEALDPDVLVGDLGITTQQLLDAFPDEAEAYIEKEFM